MRRSSSRSQRSGLRRRKHFIESLESRCLLAALSGQLWADDNGNGQFDNNESPIADQLVYIDANSNGTFQVGEPVVRTNRQGQYTFQDLAAGSYIVRQNSEFTQSSPNTFFGLDAVSPTQTQLFEMQPNGELFRLGSPQGNTPGTATLEGLIRTTGDALYAIDVETDSLYALSGQNGQQTLIGDTGFEVAPGLAYDATNDVIYAIGTEDTDPLTTKLFSIDRVSGAGSLIAGVGLTGIGDVADITFDPANDRIVGFDNASQQFFQFGIDGTAALLATADRTLSSGSLAKNGNEFLMAFESDPTDRQLLAVNPDTGQTQPRLNTSESFHPAALFYSTLGSTAHRVTVTESQELEGLDFGFHLGPVELVVTESDGDTTLARSLPEDEVAVALSREPLSLVVVDVAVDTAGVFSSETRLVFTPENWQTPQTVKLELIDQTLPDQQAEWTFSINDQFSEIAWQAVPDSAVDVDIVFEEPIATAAYINELLIDTFFDSIPGGQYLELRGEPNALLPDGTYFLVVDGDGFGPGSIETKIDLSGLKFGSNGLLVLTPANFDLPIDFAANVVQSSSQGFSGLPDSRFETTSAGGLIVGGWLDSQNYMLVQTDDPIALNDDWDADDDGVLDPTNLTVFDSVSVIHDSFFSDIKRAYSPTVFLIDETVGSGSFTVPEDAVVRRLEHAEYLARIGNSTGIGRDDWVAGLVREETILGDSFLYLEDDIFGAPLPLAFAWRTLDHVGATNFYGGVRGTVFNDSDRDGKHDSGELPVPGLTVLADTNGNGQRDVITSSILPDDLTPGTQISSIDDRVTLRVVDDNNEPTLYWVSVSREQGLIGNRNVFARQSAFGTATLPFSEHRLRMDFFRPASSVSLTFVGNETLASDFTRGVIELYNDQDQRIATRSTFPLRQGERQTLTASSFGESIAYAVARVQKTGFSSAGNSSGWMDDLIFTQREATAVTDDQGRYALPFLSPDDYEIILLNSPFDVSNTPLDATVTGVENFQRDIGLFNNSSPQLLPFRMTVNEHSSPGTTIGYVFGTDVDRGQALQYQIVGGNAADAVSINPTTGRLAVRRPQDLDFEQNPNVVVQVQVSDPLGATATSNVTIDLLDVNDRPTVEDSELIVAENALPDTFVGRVAFSDVDQGAAGTSTIRIVSDDGQFRIDPLTGDVFVVDGSRLDFETRPRVGLLVEVTDQADVPLSQRAEIFVEVRDVNEAPVILTEALNVSEAALPGTPVGQVQISDVDQGQNYFYRIVGGTGQDLFTLNRITGVLTLGSQPLDFETTPTYMLDLLVSDSGTPSLSDTQTVLISVADTNEPPFLLSQPVLTIAENSPSGTQVGILEARDPDPSQAITFVILDGEGAGQFSIETVFDNLTGITSGVISVSSTADLDFETDAFETLRIGVLDNGTPVRRLEREITIGVLDQPETPVILSTEFAVNENWEAGRFVGLLDVFEPDTGDDLQFEIIGGSAADQLELDPNNGTLRVAPGASFDFESISQWDLEVQVTDTTDRVATQTLTIQVIDGNESPEFNRLIENQRTKSSTPFSLTFEETIASDFDAGQTVSLSVIGADAPLPGWLQFDAETRTLSGFPSPSDIGLHFVALRATDSGAVPASAVQAFTIEVTPNDTPLQNGFDRFDVNNDQRVDALDVARIILYLNRFGIGPVDESLPFFGFVDVNGDNRVTPTDALDVINQMNRLNRIVPSGEAAGNRMASIDYEDLDRRKERVADEALRLVLTEDF